MSMLAKARWTALAPLAAAALLSAATAAFGQSARERPPGAPARAQEQQGHSRESRAKDHVVSSRELIGWLLIENRGEIELAQFALEKTQNPSVREFAQRMVQDHQQFAQQLQRAAGTETRESGSQSEAERGAGRSEVPVRRSTDEIRDAVRDVEPAVEDSNRNEQERRAQSGQRKPASGSGRQEIEVRKVPQPFHAGGTTAAGGGWLALKQQLSREMAEAIKEELQDKQGAEFDLAFMSAQVYSHLEQLNTLRVFQKEAGPELREVLQQGARTTQEHMEKARTVLREIDRQDEDAGSRSE